MISSLLSFAQPSHIIWMRPARSYWVWLQDSQFLTVNSPATKIHIIRIRDEQNNEAPQGYAFTEPFESFEEGDASFGQGICMPQGFEINNQSFTQSVLSVAQKPGTNTKLRKDFNRLDSPSVAWKAPQPRLHNILSTFVPIRLSAAPCNHSPSAIATLAIATLVVSRRGHVSLTAISSD